MMADAARTGAGLPFTIVTGASEGIGRAFAVRLARQGDNLLLIARGAQKLEDMARALVASGGLVRTLALDVTAPDAADTIALTLTGLGGHADALIINAGVGLSGAFVEAEAGSLETLIAVNIAAPTRLARHFLPGMVARRRGGVLFMASLGAYTPGPGQAAYYASKAYIVSLSEALAAETAGTGVHVTCVAPGPVKTAFHTKMGAETSAYRTLLPSQSPDTVARLGLLAFRLGLRTVVPGVLTGFGMMALRVLPHRLTTPVVAALLRRWPFAGLS